MDSSGHEVATVRTTSGPSETVIQARSPDGAEVTTAVKTGTAQNHISDDFGHYVAIWSKAVDTQMHFNEMSVKSRQLGLTFVAAALGVAVVLMSQQKDYSIDVFHFFKLHVAVLLVLAGAGAIYLVSILDLGVYHRMLRGAVAFGEELEELKLKPRLNVECGMTQAISLFSRYPDTTFDRNTTPRYCPSKDKVTAEHKIRRFYTSTIRILLGSAIILFVVTCPPDATKKLTPPASRAATATPPATALSGATPAGATQSAPAAVAPRGATPTSATTHGTP